MSAHSSSHGGRHSSHGKQHTNRLFLWILLLSGAAAVAVLSANRYLLSAHVLDSPILPHEDAEPLNIRIHVADERLLRLVVEECAKREESIIWLDKEGQMVVQEALDFKQCPTMDVLLPGRDRDLTTCTDIALYVMHTGARIMPLLQAVDMERYNTGCGAATARMFWHTMYPQFIANRPDVLHVMLVDHNQLLVDDARLHRHMNVFLCKTRVCLDLMQRHVIKMGYRGHVWLMGHTSSDPSVDVRQGTQGKDLSFLHIKGRSPLRHTQQLLRCWASQPEFPRLTVVGAFTWDEVKEYGDAINIRFLPQVNQDTLPDQPPRLLVPTELRQLQADSPVHICPSQSEGWGHTINEARAVGAVVLTTDHPPMNEFVSKAKGPGLVIPVERLLAYRELALAKYEPLDALIDEAQLCDVVELVLQMPAQEVYERGQQARTNFLYEKAVFMARMQDLRAFLEQRAQGLQGFEQRSGLGDDGGLMQQRQLLEEQPSLPAV
ncbi:hypothetical protein OEZ86_009707 [Tetradesmus obliquus]|uniref:Glycosyl transferase family 1 domain-containing protein n=1 Tax=Tetradesmus obliquus TaxID=3088 RepID=A0ABY8UN33_TETOB|nr:hypothetical protein OEZ85_001151 [Tetradesmus obliquus]WIA43199.1 hypothetical protein OEZ86_009707 [Tetradesmus obliquus]